MYIIPEISCISIQKLSRFGSMRNHGLDLVILYFLVLPITY